jgi:hypothetical protein
MGRDSGELQETPFELVFLDYTGSVQNYGADLRYACMSPDMYLHSK